MQMSFSSEQGEIVVVQFTLQLLQMETNSAMGIYLRQIHLLKTLDVQHMLEVSLILNAMNTLTLMLLKQLTMYSPLILSSFIG